MNNSQSPFRTPFDRIERLYGDLEPVLDALWGRVPSQKAQDGFVPTLSVWEEDERFVVETELPGVPPKDVEITLEGRELRIRGERKPEQTEKSEKTEKRILHRQERVYGQFQRVVRFPADVNPEGVEAKAQDGVLRVTVKKSESLKPKRIQVA